MPAELQNDRSRPQLPKPQRCRFPFGRVQVAGRQADQLARFTLVWREDIDLRQQRRRQTPGGRGIEYGLCALAAGQFQPGMNSRKWGFELKECETRTAE